MVFCKLRDSGRVLEGAWVGFPSAQAIMGLALQACGSTAEGWMQGSAENPPVSYW